MLPLENAGRRSRNLVGQWPQDCMAVCASRQENLRRQEHALRETRSEVNALGERLPLGRNCGIVAICLYVVSGGFMIESPY